MSYEQTTQPAGFEQLVDPSSSEISSLIGLMRLEHPAQPPTSSIELKERIDYYTNPDRTALFVARMAINNMNDARGEVVGYAAVREAAAYTRKSLDVKHLFVRPTAQRRKLGRGLLDTVIDYAGENGFEEIQASLIPHAFAGHRLLRTSGFVRDHTDGIYVRRSSK